MRSASALLIAATLVALIVTYPARLQADPVYKWEDPNGVVHFASKAPSKNAKPAELPKITRAEVKLAKTKLVSCETHGGINCQAGADSDGSVICFDGFKEASARFRFSCSSPKLEISDVSEITPAGGFTVFVRNSKSVVAKKPSVAFKPEAGPDVSLIGPEEIEPFGLAEFTLPNKPEIKQKLALKSKPTVSQLTVACANCP